MKKWSKKPQAQKKRVLSRFLVWSSRRSGQRIMPAHSVSHQLNAAQTARWYLEKIGASGTARNLAELGSIGHDIVRMGKGHGIASAKIMGNVLAKRIGSKPLARMTSAMARHGIPAIKNGVRLRSDPVADAVFFADRMEALGAYAAFRLPASDGELPFFHKMFEERLAKRLGLMECEKLAGAAKQQALEAAKQQAKIDVILWDVDDCLKIGKNPGYYKDGVAVDTLPAEKYYPAEVMPIVKKYIGELEEFYSGLMKRETWALEIANAFYDYGRESTKQLNELIEKFRPKTNRAKEFRRRALNYIAGKIEKG